METNRKSYASQEVGTTFRTASPDFPRIRKWYIRFGITPVEKSSPVMPTISTAQVGNLEGI